MVGGDVLLSAGPVNPISSVRNKPLLWGLVGGRLRRGFVRDFPAAFPSLQGWRAHHMP